MPPRRAGKVLEVSQKIDWGNFTPSVFPEVRWGSWSLGESCVCVCFFLLFFRVLLVYRRVLNCFGKTVETFSFPSFHYSEFMFYLVFFLEALVKTRQPPRSNHRDSKITLLFLWVAMKFLHGPSTCRPKSRGKQLQNSFFFVGYSWIFIFQDDMFYVYWVYTNISMYTFIHVDDIQITYSTSKWNPNKVDHFM